MVLEWAGTTAFPRFDPRSGWHADAALRHIADNALQCTRRPKAGVDLKFALNTGSGFQ
jgi:hypothetical protein